MQDDKVKLFIDKVSDYKVDDIILRTLEKRFSNEIKELEHTAEEIGDKVIDASKNLGKRKPKKDPMEGTTPVLLSEQVEVQLRSSEPNSVNSLMKPVLPSGEKKSKFINRVRVDVGLENIEFSKKVDKELTLSTEATVWKKTVGIGIKKTFENSKIKFKGGVEYNPIKQRGKLKLNYNTPEYNLSSNIYLQKNNCGINTNYFKPLSFNSSVNAGVSVFQGNAAFKVDYNKTFADKTKMCFGAYGSTANKEVGVTARIGLW